MSWDKVSSTITFEAVELDLNILDKIWTFMKTSGKLVNHWKNIDKTIVDTWTRDVIHCARWQKYLQTRFCSVWNWQGFFVEALSNCIAAWDARCFQHFCPPRADVGANMGPEYILPEIFSQERVIEMKDARISLIILASRVTGNDVKPSKRRTSDDPLQSMGSKRISCRMKEKVARKLWKQQPGDNWYFACRCPKITFTCSPVRQATWKTVQFQWWLIAKHIYQT